MSVLIVIPARMSSSRFPGKPLAEIAGRSLILRVCDRAARIPGATGIRVATDDARIFDHVTAAGYEAVMTSSEHASGSDRAAEASRGHQGPVLDLQGDEPLADPLLCGRLVERLESDSGLDMVTAGVPLAAGEDLQPDRVKVVLDRRGLAVDFLRLLPAPPGPGLRALRHAGIYLYRPEALRRFAAAGTCERERNEGLEQSRALDMGLRIGVVEGVDWPPGVDRPEDLKLIESRLASD